MLDAPAAVYDTVHMLSWTERLTRLSEQRWLLLLTVVALCTRLVWAAAMVERESRFDEVAYLRHAAQLCASQSYLDAAGRPTDYWPIGFPLVLAGAVCVSGGHSAAGVSLQITIGLFTCLLVSMLGERTFGRAPGRVAGLVMALYPTHVFYSTLLLTEPLVTLVLFAAAACLLASLRGSLVSALAGGLFLGYAILTRPVLILFPCAIPIWYGYNGQAVRRAARYSILVACGVLIVVSPWMVRNYRLFGRWAEVSSTGGYNFLLGNSSGALGGYAHAPGLRGQMRSDGTEDWSHGYRLGWEAIRREPAAAVARAIQKISYFFALETDGVLWNLKGLDLAFRSLQR
jgi:4-amino-4-deoxy-L-arabinose transferase-like glycosyltransferase